MTVTQVETIETKEREYRVRRQGDSHRYPVTVPTDILDAAGIEHQDDIGISVDFSEQTLLIKCSVDAPARKQISVSKYENTGEIRIPSAIGAVFDLGDEEVTWRVDKAESQRLVIGDTTKKVGESQMGSSEPLLADSLSHVTQNIDSNEYGSWSQEQFRIYLRTEHLSPLKWVEDQQVDLSVQVNQEKPVLVFEPTEGEEEYLTQNATATGFGQADAILNIPNDIARVLGLVDTELLWTEENGALFAIPRDWNPTLSH